MLREATQKGSGKFSVFDPCTARHVEPLQQAVRNLAGKVGVKTEELPKGDMHGCCGYGGHVAVTNPEYYDYVAKKPQWIERKSISGLLHQLS